MIDDNDSMERKAFLAWVDDRGWGDETRDKKIQRDLWAGWKAKAQNDLWLGWKARAERSMEEHPIRALTDYEADQAAAEESLRPRLTDEFLSTLVQAVRTVGHLTDHVESIALVQEVFAIAGKKSPELDDMHPFADQDQK